MFGVRGHDRERVREREREQSILPGAAYEVADGRKEETRRTGRPIVANVGQGH